MSRYLLIFLIAVAFAVAMVPSPRRLEETENEEVENGTQICAPQTPCAWSVYKKGLKNLIELNYTNTYCVCDVGQACSYDQDDEEASAYVFHCLETS